MGLGFSHPKIAKLLWDLDGENQDQRQRKTKCFAIQKAKGYNIDKLKLKVDL